MLSRSVGRAVFYAAFFAAFVLWFPAPSISQTIPEALALHKEQQLSIMVLGDSITAGVGAEGGPSDTGGYRGPLQTLLQDGGYHVTFVGVRTDYAAKLTSPNHEGWPGYTIRSIAPGPPGQLLGTITERALSAYNPDLILLMAGTNDLLHNYDENEIVHSMDLLLGQIFSLRPHVRVVLGGVVDSPRVPECEIARFDTGRSSCSEEIYPSLPSLAKSFAERGYAVVYAAGMDQAVPRDAEHFPDGIHPSGADGYAAVAGVWYKAIRAITIDEPGPVSLR
jgi:lysophospholipase L1-like esterase